MSSQFKTTKEIIEETHSKCLFWDDQNGDLYFPNNKKNIKTTNEKWFSESVVREAIEKLNHRNGSSPLFNLGYNTAIKEVLLSLGLDGEQK